MMLSTRKRLVLIVALLFTLIASTLAFAFTAVPALANATGRMIDGASIRYGEDRPGIRFSTYVPDSYFTDGELKEGVEVGMLLVQAHRGTEDDLKIDTTNANVKKICSNDTNFVWVKNRDARIDIDGFQRYNVVVTGIPNTAAAYSTEIIAKSYIKVGDNSPEYATNTQTRSIARVSNQLLAENVISDALSTEEVSDLEGYVVAVNKPVQKTAYDRFFHVEGENLVWGAYEGAIGYYVCMNGQIINTAETSIELSEFENPVGKALIVAYGNGVDYSYSGVEFCYAVEGESTILGVAHGGYNFRTPSVAAAGLVKAEYSEQESAVAISVDTAGSTRFAAFRLDLANAISFTENDGVNIKFKVIEQPFTQEGDVVWFTFVGDSANWNESGGNYDTPHIEVVEGEWQVLSLTNAQLKTMLADGDQYITLCVLRRSGVAANGIAKVLIDGVYNYNVLETPTNLKVSEKVASWSAVENADGYVLSFNGEEQAVVTEPSFDLTSLVGSLTSYTVKVKAVVNNLTYVDSAYTSELVIVEEPANVLASFNNEIYTSSVSACGVENSLTSATYLSANANDGFGGHDGAVEMTLSKAGAGFVNMFTVTLPKAIAFDDTMLGLKVRMRLVSTPENNYSDGLDVFIGDPNKDAAGEYSLRTYSTKYGHLVAGGDWVEIAIPSSALSSFVGQKDIHLGLGFDNGQNSGPAFRNANIVVQIDYIEYNYIPTISEPANVLASFNSELYVDNVSQLDADSPISKVEFLSANANDGFGGHDGAVQITINQAGYTYMPMVVFNLANTLDLTNNSKVKVRMRIVSYPYSIEEVNVYVAYEMASSGSDYSPVKYNDIHGTLVVGGDWTEITLDNAKNDGKMGQLYDGTKLLGIGFGKIKDNGEPFRYDQGGTVVIQIDYIQYA